MIPTQTARYDVYGFTLRGDSPTTLVERAVEERGDVQARSTAIGQARTWLLGDAPEGAYVQVLQWGSGSIVYYAKRSSGAIVSLPINA